MKRLEANARPQGEAEARHIVQQAQRQADQVFAELDELRKQQQRSDYQAVNDRKSDIRRRLNEAETALHQRDEDTEPVPAPSRPIAVGDTVELAGVRTGAAVLAVNGDGTLRHHARMVATPKFTREQRAGRFMYPVAGTSIPDRQPCGSWFA